MRRIAGQYVFTGLEFIKHGFVETDNSGKIINVGSLGESITEQGSTEFYNGIIVPGFVNTHCHIELSHMLGKIPGQSGMAAFCEAIKTNRNTETEDEQLALMTDADKFMENEGIVAVGDVSNSVLSLEMKKNSNLFYHTFIETLGLSTLYANDIFFRAKELKQAFAKEKQAVSIAPHAPYSLSEKLFEMSVNDGNISGIISIHNSESKDELELFDKKDGKIRALFGNEMDLFLPKYNNPLYRILQYIKPDTRLLLVHNTYTTAHDVEQVKKCNKKTSWVLCPGSNLYIEDKLPDVEMFYNKNLHVTIGTDSLSSNKKVSVLNELKILNSCFPKINLGTMLQWATLNGAEALNINQNFGSFDVGKKPGVLILSGIDFKNMKLTENSNVKRLV